MTQHADTVREPIWVWCEGSGCPPASEAYPICSMCGHFIGRSADGRAFGHYRDDILARIERGDFG